MSFYPATIVSVTPDEVKVRVDATGKEIVFAHAAFNAVPNEFRHVGAAGFISFPKAPPVFTTELPQVVALH